MRKLLLCGSLALFTACHGSDGPRSCTATRECPGLERCLGKVCGASDAGATLAQGVLGAPCTADTDCAAGLGCLQSGLGFPSGACSVACNSAACPAKALCTDLRDTDAGVVACAPTCQGDGDCRLGFTCCPAFDGGACVPNADCPSTTLSASPDLGRACSPAGDRCAPGESCQGGQPFPGGACTTPCVVGNDATCPPNGACANTETGAWCLQKCSTSSDCRAGYDCVSAPGASASFCRAHPPACAGGLGLDAGPPRACTPGDLPQLLTGNAGQPVGPASPPAGCQKPLVCSSLGAAQVQAFGSHQVGDVVQFTVPPGTASLSIVSQALSANDSVTFNRYGAQDNTVVPDKLRGPDGGLLYDDIQPPSDDAGTILPTVPVYYGAGTPGTGALTIPNTTAALRLEQGGGLPPGKWSFTVNDYALECFDPAIGGCTFGGSRTNVYDVQVLTKPGPLAAQGGVDVAFYIASSHGGVLNSSTAPANPSVRRMVQTLSKLYARAGICLNSVTFYDLPAWAQAKYSTVSGDNTGPCDDLSQLFTLSQPGLGVSFFLVESITAKAQGGAVVGIDGTIPGPGTFGGTIHSGAAVSVASLFAGSCGTPISLSSCGADEVAYIAAHEGGHFLGLFHTSEATGDSWDSLDDTGICDCTRCTSAPAHCAVVEPSNQSPTLVPPGVCRQPSSTRCSGADNLMFWEFDNQSVGNLSPQQGQVMRANPVVR